jgi:glycosyltransferase involved in cell wall biosynthesis
MGPQTNHQRVKISIITVVYNGEATLRDCIESVLGQTYPHVEYIVVDGASTDGTLAVARSFGPKIATLISEPDRGIYDAMNKGIAAATGEVVGILNADDEYAHPNVLAHVAEALQTQSADAAYGDLLYVDPRDSSRVIRTWRAGAYRPGAFLYGWMPPHPTFFVRRTVYEQFGGFNLSLRSAADYEFMLRLVHRHGIRLAYLPEVLVHMRAGGVSNASFRNRWRANREDRRAWRLNGLRPYFFTLWWKPLRKLVQYLRRPA